MWETNLQYEFFLKKYVKSILIWEQVSNAISQRMTYQRTLGYKTDHLIISSLLRSQLLFYTQLVLKRINLYGSHLTISNKVKDTYNLPPTNTALDM